MLISTRVARTWVGRARWGGVGLLGWERRSRSLSLHTRHSAANPQPQHLVGAVPPHLNLPPERITVCGYAIASRKKLAAGCFEGPLALVRSLLRLFLRFPEHWYRIANFPFALANGEPGTKRANLASSSLNCMWGREGG